RRVAGKREGDGDRARRRPRDRARGPARGPPGGPRLGAGRIGFELDRISPAKVRHQAAGTERAAPGERDARGDGDDSAAHGTGPAESHFFPLPSYESDGILATDINPNR